MILKELHQHLYDILCAVDTACRMEQVSYMLAGGTLLGAIRHQGFIPWDDDIDILIWRKDYPAMKAALEKHLPPWLQITEPEDFLPSFYDFIIRIQDTRFFFHPPSMEDLHYKNRQNYISVDVFLLDNSAHTRYGIKLFALAQRIIYGMAMGHRYQISYAKYNFFQKIQVALLSYIGSLLSMETLISWQKRLSIYFQNKPGKYCMVTNDLPQNIDLPYERAWFENIINKKFEDRLFPIQNGYHQKLTMQYGDYMKPPEDQSIYIRHTDSAS